VDKPVEGSGHRRAVRAHHLTKHFVCEPQRKMNTVGLDSTPPIGEVPQQEQEPVLYALRLEDRQPKRQPARPSYRSLQENWRHGRQPWGRPTCELLIEDREARGLHHDPAHPRTERFRVCQVVSRPQEVLGADELGEASAREEDVSGQKPFEDERPKVILIDRHQVGEIGRAARELDQRNHGSGPEVAARLVTNPTAEVRILVEQPDCL
jgi:hypothetical protein